MILSMLHYILLVITPLLIVVYILFTILMVIQIRTDYLIDELLEKVKASWDEGNIFGKLLTAIVTAIGFIPLMPALVITLILWLLENALGLILMSAFPNRRSCRIEIPVEVPLPDQETLQKLRDNKISFIIGKDHIKFEYQKDYKQAKEILKEGTISNEKKKSKR